jgi:threonylcarbamoyladenosine tRNA methylthiotransferase MtaB
MKRRYLTQLYRNRVSKIREVMPDACIGVDVIVGFQGETEEEFMKTYQFLNELPILIYTFSLILKEKILKRLQCRNIVPVAERKKRNKMLRILSEKRKWLFTRLS